MISNICTQIKYYYSQRVVIQKWYSPFIPGMLGVFYDYSRHDNTNIDYKRSGVYMHKLNYEIKYKIYNCSLKELAALLGITPVQALKLKKMFTA